MKRGRSARPPELGNGVVRVVDRLPAFLAHDAHAHVGGLRAGRAAGRAHYCWAAADVQATPRELRIVGKMAWGMRAAGAQPFAPWDPPESWPRRWRRPRWPASCPPAGAGSACTCTAQRQQSAARSAGVAGCCITGCAWCVHNSCKLLLPGHHPPYKAPPGPPPKAPKPTHQRQRPQESPAALRSSYSIIIRTMAAWGERGHDGLNVVRTSNGY